MMRFFRILLLWAFFSVSMSLQAQPQVGDPPTPPPPNPVPLTGAEFLIAAGAALGVKKYLDLRKKKSASETEGDV